MDKNIQNKKRNQKENKVALIEAEVEYENQKAELIEKLDPGQKDIHKKSYAQDSITAAKGLIKSMVNTLTPEEFAKQNKLFGIEKLNIQRSIIPAVTHIDYSSRIQTITQIRGDCCYSGNNLISTTSFSYCYFINRSIRTCGYC